MWTHILNNYKWDNTIQTIYLAHTERNAHMIKDYHQFYNLDEN